MRINAKLICLSIVLTFLVIMASNVTVADTLEAGALTKIASNVDDYSYPAWSPRGSEILFDRDDGIYIISPDGSGEKKVSDGHSGLWSPDGSEISYNQYINEAGGIYLFELWITKADGTKKTLLLNHAAGMMPFTYYAWFHSDSKIAYTTGWDDMGYLYVINSDGSNDHQVAIEGNANGELDVSPDGSKIVYEVWDYIDLNEIRIYDLDNNKHYSSLDYIMPSHTHSNMLKIWSPDSSKILCGTDDDIFTIKADGTGVIRLTSDSAKEFDPTFSPDGSKILYVSDKTGNKDIWVMDADGKNKVQLTTDPGEDLSPEWSPDGKKIAFWSDREGDNGIYTLTLKAPLLAFPSYTNLPTDLDQNGFYEDINGNGILDFDDVVAYYDNMEWIEENEPLEFFDYNNNGLIDFDDVVKLYDML